MKGTSASPGLRLVHGSPVFGDTEVDHEGHRKDQGVLHDLLGAGGEGVNLFVGGFIGTPVRGM